MRTLNLLLLLVLLQVTAFTQNRLPPDQVYGALFTDVQLSRIFPDSKTFVDCTPRRDPAQIVDAYKKLKNNPATRPDLRGFVEENFYIPQATEDTFVTRSKAVIPHIERLWSVLRRQSDVAVPGSSLLPLPHPYIVPGGRFREVYYWDSYFTMLGLRESGERQLIRNMIDNFAYLINTYGHIPNGNRTYYLSRSQPPFFSLMVELLAGIEGEGVYTTYLPALQQEWNYWMDRSAPTRHVAHLPDGSVLNRYWDQLQIPRQESYLEDLETVRKAKQDAKVMYRHLRSGAESGWDFSSRWFADGENISTIQTTDIVPVDLNSLLYHLEATLARAYRLAGKSGEAATYTRAADNRKKAINKYCWSAAQGWYADYNVRTHRHSREQTLAGMVPFFMGLGDANKMAPAAMWVRLRFLKDGGVVTTLRRTGQQWDAPNGWAPLQWMTIVGLEQYGRPELAHTIAGRWVDLNRKVFAATGKLMEKYDVQDINRPAGGGEYPSQDGFGWTNGVLQALISKYGWKEF